MIELHGFCLRRILTGDLRFSVFHERGIDGGHRFRAQWGELHVRLDATYKLDNFAEGVIIHDGRIDRWENDPIRWNGSFLAIAFPYAQNGDNFQCVSDRLGTVPLYWAVDDTRIFFSTRLDYLIQQGFRELDPIGGWQLILFNTPLWERTLLQNVNLMFPGSRLEFHRDRSPETETYWRALINRDGPSRPDADYADDLIAVLRAAHKRALQYSPGPMLCPVTGGLDSRMNLALHRERWHELELFHCHAKGSIEAPIAKEVARVVGRQLTLFPEKESVRRVLELDPWQETGELNAAQWWLEQTFAGLPEVSSHGVLLDGYMQDVLLKASLIDAVDLVDETVAMRTAIHRLKSLGISSDDPTIREVLDRFREQYPRGDSLGASQSYYLANRSRRFVFGTVRLAGNHIRVATPGMDNELLDFGFGLPWALRKNAVLYKQAIRKMAPDLAKVRYDKTGLSLFDTGRISWRLKLKRSFWKNIAWYWPDFFYLPTTEADLGRLMSKNSEFAANIRSVLNGSEWIAGLLSGSSDIDRALKGITGDRNTSELTYSLLTIARLDSKVRELDRG